MKASDPAALIAALWEQFRPVVAERLATVDSGLNALADGASRGDEAVREAHRAAHNLAGALGSYGRPEGSVVARALMGALESSPVDVAGARHLLTELEEHCR